jgi:hypothetical protein
MALAGCPGPVTPKAGESGSEAKPISVNLDDLKRGAGPNEGKYVVVKGIVIEDTTDKVGLTKGGMHSYWFGYDSARIRVTFDKPLTVGDELTITGLVSLGPGTGDAAGPAVVRIVRVTKDGAP